MSGENDIEGFSHVIALGIFSFIFTSVMNILADNKLKEAEKSVNMKPVEKFIFNKRMRGFQVMDWGSIQMGEILKIKQNQEVPCDCLIIDIVGSKAA